MSLFSFDAIDTDWKRGMCFFIYPASSVSGVSWVHPQFVYPCPFCYKPTFTSQRVPLTVYSSPSRSVCCLTFYGNCSWVFLSRIFFFPALSYNVPSNYNFCLKLLHFWGMVGFWGFNCLPVLLKMGFVSVSLCSCHFWIILYHFSGK